MTRTSAFAISSLLDNLSRTGRLPLLLAAEKVAPVLLAATLGQPHMVLPLIRLPAPSPRSNGEKGDVALSALQIPSPRARGEGGGSRVRGRLCAYVIALPATGRIPA